MTATRTSPGYFLLHLLWLGLLLGFSSKPFAAEDYSTWPHFMDLNFDTSPDGANISSPVLDFPVLVRLKAADFAFAEARGNGHDIRFATPGGTHLAFEIERYDSTKKIAEIWVRVDVVKANFKGAFARMYWGGDTASASSPGAVFSKSNGFSNVWHMGGNSTTPRLSAVTGSADLDPKNYNGDESTDGIMGRADSLGGCSSSSTCEYLQTYQNYDSLNVGFTYSLWVNPTSVEDFARFMDFGNGPAQSNLILGRRSLSEDIYFEAFNNSSLGGYSTSGGILLNEWQYFDVTISGKLAKLYKNGSLLRTDTLNDTLSGLRWKYNYIGKSNWDGNAYYKGKVDEPIVARVARSGDWIKLCYANQKADQNLVSFTVPMGCSQSFSIPKDTTVLEGSVFNLEAKADCAVSYSWGVKSGPAVRIFDQEIKILTTIAPRIAKDTFIVYQFSAQFSDSTRTKVVTVSVKESIPDPIFTLSDDFIWDGNDSAVVQATVSNLAAIQASTQPKLNYTWTLTGSAVDTVLNNNSLLLKAPRDNGNIVVKVCIDNRGPSVCKSMNITLEVPVLRLRKAAKLHGNHNPKEYDAGGRRVRGKLFQLGLIVPGP